MIRHALTAAALILVAAAGAGWGRAVDLPSPTGPVILTVSGAIAHSNAADEAVFDRSMLAELDWTTIESFTAWTDGLDRFSGIRLRSLLTAVGAHGTTIVARALNDYSATLPITDAETFGVFLALDRDGQPMPIRDKGPIWIIYPESEPQHDTVGPHNFKMIWQLQSLEIR